MPDATNPLAGPNPPPTSKQFYSLGFLCQQLQQLPPQVMTIADSAGVEPAHYIDGVPFFRGDAVVRMAEHVAKFRQAVERQTAAN
jgi:hypothetical protein